MKKHIALSLLLIASYSYAMNDNDIFDFDALIAEAQKDADESFPPASQEQEHHCDSEFFCKMCNQSFESKGEYDEMTHMENVHHLCTVCNQTFDAGHEVRWHHLMTHAKREDFKRQ